MRLRNDKLREQDPISIQKAGADQIIENEKKMLDSQLTAIERINYLNKLAYSYECYPEKGKIKEAILTYVEVIIKADCELQKPDNHHVDLIDFIINSLLMLATITNEDNITILTNIVANQVYTIIFQLNNNIIFTKKLSDILLQKRDKTEPELTYQLDKFILNIKRLSFSKGLIEPCNDVNWEVIEKVKDRDAISFIGARLLAIFLLDTQCCDVFEDIFMELVGIKKDKGECKFGNELNSFKEKDLEQKHTPDNSIFLQLTLSNPQSITKLQNFAQKNGIEFRDYTHILSDQERELGIKLIRIDSHGARTVLLPKIENFLKQNPNALKKYLEITREKYKEFSRKSKTYQERDFFQEKIAKIDSRIHQLESSKPTFWGGLFSNRTAAAVVTSIATGFVLAAAYSNRMK